MGVKNITDVTDAGSNCTFMELKLALKAILTLYIEVLIVPLWN